MIRSYAIRCGRSQRSRAQEDLGVLAGMIEAGQVIPVIDESYSLGEVPEELIRQATGHARGKTVIAV